MSDIRQWLEELGLDQYAETFDDNEISAALLGELNNDILKDIGVAIAGHRMQILKAARAFARRPDAADVLGESSHGALTPDA